MKEDNKPITDVEYGNEFSVKFDNILSNTSVLIRQNYETIDMNSTDGNIILDASRVNEKNTTIMIVLKYFEYLCIADVSFSYIKPILLSGFNIKDVFGMIKHHLRTKLTKEVGNSEQINDIHVEYYAKIKY